MSKEVYSVKSCDYNMFKWYFSLRTPSTCENAVVDSFLWAKYYDSKYYYTEKGLLWLLRNKDGIFTVTPLCKTEDLKDCFLDIETYFHEELHQKLEMYLVDEEALHIIDPDPDRYDVIEERQYFDYVYDGDKLRTLSGKAYHKKKNHINSFVRQYGERFQYRTLDRENKDAVMNFLSEWNAERGMIDPYNRLDSEEAGIRYLLYECTNVPIHMGGIYIDDKLQAFSIGSYSKTIDMAYIHVEKANPEIRGLYNVMNQQFLIHEFPNVSRINREDDMGLEGLRKSKLSYNPIELVKKYSIIEKE